MTQPVVASMVKTGAHHDHILHLRYPLRTPTHHRLLQPNDVVYHLGDFTLKTRGFARRIFARLQGDIRVLGLPWHHDKGWVPKQPGRCELYSASGHAVEILPPLLAIKAEGVPCGVLTLSHYPMAEWEARYHGAWHLHGHSHGNHRGPARGWMWGWMCTNTVR